MEDQKKAISSNRVGTNTIPADSAEDDQRFHGQHAQTVDPEELMKTDFTVAEELHRRTNASSTVDDEDRRVSSAVSRPFAKQRLTFPLITIVV